MSNKHGIREWLQGIENEILYAVCDWIIKRRGVAFIYWVDPDEWEKYFREECQA